MFNTTLNTTERPWDGWLLLIVCALVGIGIVMIYSASGITATWLTGDSAFFLKRQLIYLAGGLLFLIFGLKVDYHWYRRTAWPIFAGTILVLAAVLFVGTDVNGARRWIRLGFFNVQPAEIAKVTLVFVLAYSMTKKNDLMKTFSVGILPHIILIGCVVGLLLKQPDFGSSAIIVILTGVMLLVAGTRMIYLIGGAIVGGLGASPHLLGRLSHEANHGFPRPLGNAEQRRVSAHAQPHQHRIGGRRRAWARARTRKTRLRPRATHRLYRYGDTRRTRIFRRHCAVYSLLSFCCTRFPHRLPGSRFIRPIRRLWNYVRHYAPSATQSRRHYGAFADKRSHLAICIVWWFVARHVHVCDGRLAQHFQMRRRYLGNSKNSR